ncbi:metallopeptidase TldD-related protein [Kitasatospora sp. NPDC051170]|uniref:metallopeptidase TldD-related protein n=1 Tax=Kitasatospora sp. NPDC051170 TaxID=3364056 RepID=UPI0037AACBE3
MTAGPDVIAHRRVTVSGPAAQPAIEPAVAEEASGPHPDAPLVEAARLREAAVALHRAASAVAEGAGAADTRVAVRLVSRWVNRELGALGYVPRTRLEALVQLRVVGPSGRAVPLLWQWAGADPLAALGATADRLAGEIRAALTAAPLAEPFAGPVVLAADLAVHFAHETLGHSLEADNYRGYAAGAGLALGTRVASEVLTVLDGPVPDGAAVDGTGLDGAAVNGPGLDGAGLDGSAPGGLETSQPVDDEGHPAAVTPLVDAGVVSGVLTDAREAREQGLPRTGNGRRAFGAGRALPRMSSVCVARGATPAGELIGSVRRGLYCRGAWGGGSVEEFFVIRPAYAEWIEDGELTGRLVGRLDLKGRKTAALRSLRQVGDDLAVFNPVTGCGKDGQELPVSMASPSLGFERLTAVPLPVARRAPVVG